MEYSKDQKVIYDYTDWERYPWPGRPGWIRAAKVLSVKPDKAVVSVYRGGQQGGWHFTPTGPTGMKYAEVGGYAVVCRDGTRTFVPAAAIEAATAT